MWRLATVLGAVANLMPEHTRSRWRNDPVWGPLFSCMMDILRARGPEWRRERGMTNIDSTPTQLPTHLQILCTNNQDSAANIIGWAEKWVPKEIWVRLGTYFRNFHHLTAPQRQQAVVSFAGLAQNPPHTPDQSNHRTPPTPPPPTQTITQSPPHHPSQEIPNLPSTHNTARFRHGTPSGYRGRPEIWKTKVPELHALPMEDVLLRPFRPIRHIPRRCMPAVAGIVREVCYMTTSTDPQTQESGAILWALLPRMLFAAVVDDAPDSSTQTHRGQAIRAEVEKRLAQFRSGEWGKLLPPDVPLKSPSDEMPEASSRAKECIRQVRAGLMARGMAALNAVPLAPADERTFEATRKTLQAADRPLPAVDLGIPFTPKMLDYPSSLTVTMIRKAARGISPGLMGWRNEFLKELLAFPEAVQGLHRLICCVASGYTPTTLRAIMLMDRTTPLLKELGSPDGTHPIMERKVRPIEGKDTIRKLATRIPMELEKEAIAAQLAPYQMAVGVPGGAEVMSKSSQAAADVMGLCLIKIDGTSAFNLQKRSVAFQAMHRAAPHTATVLAQFYQHASLKLVQVGKKYRKLWVNTGWEQGDPGAPPGFAFGMDVSLRALSKDLEARLKSMLGPQSQHCYRIWSYLDDLIVGIPPPMVLETLELVASHLDTSGYVINWKKLEIYSLNPPPPQATWRSHWTGHQDIDLKAKWTTEGMVLLGSDQLEPGASGFHSRPPVWIGSNKFHANTSQVIIAQAETMLGHLDTLLDHAPPTAPALSVALLLLRQCIFSRSTYSFRSAYTDTLLQAAQALDSLFQARLRTWLALPRDLPPIATYLLTAPLRHGGLGITPLRDLAPEAYIGSWGLVAHAVENQLQHPLQLLASQPSTMAQLSFQAAMRELPLGAVDPEAICLQPERRLQRRLSQSRYAHGLAQQRSAAPLRDHVLLGNLSTRGSSTFLTAFPADNKFSLSDSQLRTFIRFRLQCPVMQQGPCANRNCSRHADEFGRHAMACNGKATVRHDSTQNLLMEDFRAYGLSASNRPSGSRFHHIPDLEIDSTIQPGKTWLEFYIPDPTLDTRMQQSDRASASPNLERLYKTKLQQEYHIPSSTKAPDDLLPMVWSVYGNPLPDTLTALKSLASRTAGAEGRTIHLLANRWHALAHFNVAKEVVRMIRESAGDAPASRATQDWAEPVPPVELLEALPGPWSWDMDDL